MFTYMSQLIVFLLLSLASVDSPLSSTGVIEGSVVNGSQADIPIPEAVVTLRADQNGSLEPIAQTVTDSKGHFVFEGLTLDPKLEFLPGADRDGIHYPGKRLRLTSLCPKASTAIRTFDAISTPSPLQASRHDIEIRIEESTLAVSESILVVNPSRRTFVGAPSDEQPAVTLALSIPPDFDRVTFNSEFYGRRFRVVDHRPITDIPWPPGERELKFTYRIPLIENHGKFKRPLDVPTSSVRLLLRGDKVPNVSCNLSSPKMIDSGLEFDSHEELHSTFVVEAQIGPRPIPWALYGRWGAATLLSILVCGTAAVARRQIKRPSEPTNHVVQRATSAPQVNKAKRVA